MGMAYTHFRMEIYTKENFHKGSNMEEEYTPTPALALTKVIGLMEERRELALW